METRHLLDEHAVASVAIGYLHAYVNPQHERRTAEILQAARPGLSITLASEVCPEIREFERLSTACANAYVRPLMASYIDRIRTGLDGIGLAEAPLQIMQSSGGVMTSDDANRSPLAPFTATMRSCPASRTNVSVVVGTPARARKIRKQTANDRLMIGLRLTLSAPMR